MPSDRKPTDQERDFVWIRLFARTMREGKGKPDEKRLAAALEVADDSVSTDKAVRAWMVSTTQTEDDWVLDRHREMCVDPDLFYLRDTELVVSIKA